MALASDQPLGRADVETAGTMPDFLLEMPGRDRLSIFVDGAAPLSGIQMLTGVRPVRAGMDGAVFRMSASDDVVDDLGRVPIGVLATLADGALGWAVTAALPAGAACATVALNLAVIRATAAGAVLTAAATQVSNDGRSAMSEVQITDGSGVLVARGGARLAVFSRGTVRPGARDAGIAARPFDSASGRLVAGFTCPVHDLFGLNVIHLADGAAHLSMRADKRIEQTMGAVQGGALSLFAERAMVCAVSAALGHDANVHLADLHMQFARPQQADGERLVARATVRHRGRRLAFTSVTISNSSGAVLAFGSGAAAIAAREPSAT